jgi:hypothetical protein
MDGGLTAAALVGVLDKALKADPNGEAHVEKIDLEDALKENDHHKTFTQHFKLTQTMEGEFTTNEDDKNEEKNQVNKTKKKKYGCFGSCLGKGAD